MQIYIFFIHTIFINLLNFYFLKASAYLKQGKYKDAEQLYREVLTAASEKDKPDEFALNPNNLRVDFFSS